jgi:hypothetical protein
MGWATLARWAWEAGGFLLIAVVMLDVFVTVLYARVGAGVLCKPIARGTWRAFRFVARVGFPGRGLVLSFAGPVIIVLVVVAWIVVLTLGTACVIYPSLGTGVKASNGGPTPVEFVTAIYAGGTSLAIGGSSEFAPQTKWLRLFYLFNVFLGMSAITLIITYLMEIYSALQRRNTLAVKLTLGAGKTPDAAEWLARVGSRGRFDQGYGILTEAGAEVAEIKESHHFYPVLFYFRFRDPCYATPRFTMMTLDAMALVKSALDGEKSGWLVESAAVELMDTAAREFVRMLTREFLPRGVEDPPPAPTQEEMGRWRKRYFAAVERLKAAGIATAADENAGAEKYVELRRGWDNWIQRLAAFTVYDMCDIDPCCARSGAKEDARGKTRRWRVARA